MNEKPARMTRAGDEYLNVDQDVLKFSIHHFAFIIKNTT